ncbi:hypothetical protein [Salinimicrobium sediminilitoris]|uniref:hypothetical protein n=1 Tax=Salinimicrobium sediminilitoris TaxID=2876715 RepID=UPI001E51EAA6|nr:hypothetical protein [Salinimicrobium sediminilitoris]MCC8359867.1 hypothetical protein [Salinimicrobium sediminilitoris]
MDLEIRKKEFVREFLKVQNEEIIIQLENILWKENKSVQDKAEPMSVEEFNLRIDKSMDDSRSGKLVEASDLKARMKKWS